MTENGLQCRDVTSRLHELRSEAVPQIMATEQNPGLLGDHHEAIGKCRVTFAIAVPEDPVLLMCRGVPISVSSAASLSGTMRGLLVLSNN
jgi:hypothetical protein